jgi:hypothetical protein
MSVPSSSFDVDILLQRGSHTCWLMDSPGHKEVLLWKCVSVGIGRVRHRYCKGELSADGHFRYF